jgi:AbrB family looped-hinge helix DNA binding protein
VSASVSKMTRKGQVTIPAPIRHALDIQEGDRVEFVLDGGQAKLKRHTSYVERTKGAVKTNQPPLTAEQLREAAEDAIADGALERSGG